MEISKDTENVLDALEQVFGEELLQREMMGFILEIGAGIGKPEKVNDIIFQGKISFNLAKKLNDSKSDPEGLRLVKKELDESNKRLFKILSDLLICGPEEVFETFSSGFLIDGLINERKIAELYHDLAMLKDLQSRSMEERD